jgi:hypothetical protein
MKPLIMAGFHRSGTSATALYLQACGLFVGHDLVAASSSNPLGHAEDSEIRKFHDRVLMHNGRTWIVSEPFIPRLSPRHWRELRDLVQARLMRPDAWGFKDPRVCLFLPVWRHVLPEAKVLIIYRNPRDCVRSLNHRHANELLAGLGDCATHRRFFAEPDLALRMWLLHNRRLVEFATAHPRDTLVVGFRTFLAGFPLVECLNEKWDLGLAPLNPGTTIRVDLLGEAPHRTRIASKSLVEPVIETWSRLRELEARDLGSWRAGFDSGEDEMTEREFEVDADLSRLRMENELLAFEVAFLKARISELSDSIQAKSLQTSSENAVTTRAEARLAKLLDRLEASPVRLFLRRKKWYRKALDTWLTPRP